MTAKVITTLMQQNEPITLTENTAFTKDTLNQELNLLNIYPEQQYQTVEGFGGAITESVGIVMQQVGPKLAQKIIDSYFGPDGIGYTMVRTHIDSCDFSLGNYSAVEDASDDSLSTFSLKHDDANIIPYIKMARKAAQKDISVMLTPWSPPAFMKSNGKKNCGGKLLPQYAELWAEYICKYIKQYRERGINVTRISIQNEPNATQTWDSCLYSGEEEKTFLQGCLYPALIKNDLTNVKVLAWDHNKERLYERAKDMITPETDSMIAGFAFHWYSGDHFDTVRLVHEKYPLKELMFSEGCIEYSHFDKENGLENAQMYAHDIIGNFNAGMNSFVDWNIVLDENGGPNHVGNYCEAPIICDTQTKKLSFKPSYYYISHFSKYIKPGAKRIASTCYTANIETTVFENPDHSITAVLLNQSTKDIPVVLRMKERLLPITAKGSSICTVVINGS